MALKKKRKVETTSTAENVKPAKKQRSPRSFRSIVAGVWGDIKQNIGGLARAVAIVIVPTSILSSLAVDPSGDSSLSAYIAMATLVMNGAIIFMAVNIVEGKAVRVRDAYYHGVSVVRLALVSAVLLLTLIPLALGFAIYLAAISGVAVSAGEQLIVGLITALVASPSVFLFARNILSLYVVHAQPSLAPLAAVREANAIAIGHTWLIIGRLIQLGLIILIIIVPLVIVFGIISNMIQASWPLIILQVLAALITAPLTHLYLARLHRELSS